jgi:hypothetical protein
MDSAKTRVRRFQVLVRRAPAVVSALRTNRGAMDATPDGGMVVVADISISYG